MLHGLALSIRSAEDNETFDLANQSVATIKAALEGAFREPFEKDIRLTFVTGAGKQARQKYVEGAAKAVTSTLQECGYADERAATGNEGVYKSQHDTARNLKTIVVFPKVDQQKVEVPEDSEAIESLIPKNSPGYRLSVSSMNLFSNMVKSNCPSWSQKKECLVCLQAVMQLMADFDEQLIRGQPLSDSEQTFYDAVCDLDQKVAHVKQAVQTHIQDGPLTARERSVLIEHMSEKLKETPDNEKLSLRLKSVQALTPQPERPLKHQAAIAKLYKQIKPLQKLNEDALLSVADRKLVTQRQELEAEVERLEYASSEWFEDDEGFESRLQASREKFQGKKVAKQTNAKSTGEISSKSLAATKWITPATNLGTKKKTSGKRSKGDVFSAMGDLYESSEEEDASDDDKQEPRDTSVDEKSTPVESTMTKSKKKSKRKRKKAIVAKSDDVEDQGDLNSEDSALSYLLAPLTIIWNLLVSLLGFVLIMALGKPKRKQK